jgi:hypothetical protein
VTDLFREVEEDLRREHFNKLWQKYGVYLIGLALAIVLLAGGIAGWRAWTQSARVEASARFEELVAEAEKAETPEAAAAAFAEFASDTTNGYEVLARLHQADRHLAAGEADQARAAFEAVANDGAAPDILRGMATVKAGLMLVDTLSHDDMKARMASVMRDGSPWRPHALELLALSAMREGAWSDANANAAAIIANPLSPAGLRDRAHVIQALAAPHLPRSVTEPASPAADAEEDVAPAQAEDQDAAQEDAPEVPAETE